MINEEDDSHYKDCEEEQYVVAAEEEPWEAFSDNFCEQPNRSPLFAENNLSNSGDEEESDQDVPQVGGYYDEDNELHQNDADKREEGHNGRDDDDDCTQFVAEAVVKLVEMKGESGFSIATLEILLNWGKEFHFHKDEKLKEN